MGKPTLVILAGGQGTRMLPLTQTTPKPMLKVLGKPLLEHNLQPISQHFSKIILHIGYLGDKVREYFGNEYQGVEIEYVEETEHLGTGYAFHLTQSSVQTDHVLLMYGDDLYDPTLFAKLLEKDAATIGKKEAQWQLFGVFQLKSNNLLDHIVEKPDKFVGDLVNIGLYYMPTNIYDYFNKIQKSPRGEFEFTDMLSLYAKDHPVEIIETQTGWMPITYPWHLLDLTKAKLDRLEERREGTVEEGATIKGTVVLGKNSVIKSGAYLEGNFYIGEDCEIGPNCSLKGYASIGNNVSIGNAVELTRSIVGDHTNIKHLAYIGDSVIGNHVNIAAGTITGNLRLDDATVKVMIKDTLIDTGRRKFGTVIGDNAKIAMHTGINPGRLLNSGTATLPGEIVK